MKGTYKIIARDKEEFEKLDASLSLLPPNLLINIESVEIGLVGIVIDIKESIQSNSIEIPIPSQISPFGNYIGCYCGQFFIRIPAKDNKLLNSIVFR